MSVNLQDFNTCTTNATEKWLIQFATTGAVLTFVNSGSDDSSSKTWLWIAIAVVVVVLVGIGVYFLVNKGGDKDDTEEGDEEN